MALCALPLPPHLPLYRPCPYTTLSLETLYYLRRAYARRQIKSVIVNTAAGVLEVDRLILRGEERRNSRRR